METFIFIAVLINIYMTYKLSKLLIAMDEQVADIESLANDPPLPLPSIRDKKEK